MKGLILSPKEQSRLGILGRLDRGEVTAGQAAELMERSKRQLYRLKAVWREEGAAGLAHGNRGRLPPNTLPKALKGRVMDLVSDKYTGVNLCHLTELLEEREHIRLSRSTLRRIFIEGGLERPRRRRAPKHRSRRERFPREGMLIQTDGSFHDWLEGRGPWLTLIGGIDDATGKVVAAHFQMVENSHGYFQMIRTIVRLHGLPLAFYHDGHSVFEHAKGAQAAEDERLGICDPAAGNETLTQCGRLLKSLDIGSIKALSPQAKGRIERLWKTFQDRLVSELRLAGACTREDANRVLADFLPRFNARFVVPATDPLPAWRKVSEGYREADYFHFKHERSVGKDNVIRFGSVRLQLLPGHDNANYAGCKVEVREHMGGNVTVHYRDKELLTRSAPLEATLLRNRKPCLNPIPLQPTDHPWRQWVHRETVLTRG